MSLADYDTTLGFSSRITEMHKTLVAKQAVVLSTGSRAAIPKVKGLIETQPWTNRDATAAKRATIGRRKNYRYCAMHLRSITST